MFAKVVCKRGVKVVDSVKVKPKARVKDSMTPEEAAKAAWDALDDDDKIAKFNEWASDFNSNYQVYENEEYLINEFFSNPYDAILAAKLGGYDPNDQYFAFDGYGNLISFHTSKLLAEYIPMFLPDILRWMVSNEDFGDYEDEVNGDEDEDEDED